MIDQAASAFAVSLGVLAACALVACVATLVAWTWRRTRYSRPGWWLHRHLPTRKGP